MCTLTYTHAKYREFLFQIYFFILLKMAKIFVDFFFFGLFDITFSYKAHAV